VKKIDIHFRSVMKSAGQWGEMELLNLSIQAFTTVLRSEEQEKQPGRKLLLWVGRGWPLLSSNNSMLTARTRAADFDQIVYFSRMLREDQMTAYSVALGQSDQFTGLYHGFLKGVKSDKQAVPSDLNTKVIAVQSGGQVLGPDNDLTPQLDNCIRDASTYYTLSFDPPKADARDEYHDLQPAVDKPGETARTTTGYYNEL
jgi:hypothetical protein